MFIIMCICILLGSSTPRCVCFVEGMPPSPPVEQEEPVKKYIKYIRIVTFNTTFMQL